MKKENNVNIETLDKIMESINQLDDKDDEEAYGEKLDKIMERINLDSNDIDDFLEGKTSKLKI